MRPNLESTQLLPRPVWQNPRIHLLDDSWLLTIGTILVATGVPWFTANFDVQIGTAGLGLLPLGGLHVAFTLLASGSAAPSRWRDYTLRFLHAVGVVLIGFIWAHVGALQNPLFLTVFALPVVGSIFLSRWHPYWTALLSILVVGFVALTQAPDLRWYVSGFFGHDSLWAGLFETGDSGPQSAFAGFYAPTSYLVLLLQVFAIVLFACAVAAEYLGTIFERLINHSIMARTEAEQGQDLWATLIEQLPVPALLVDPESLRVVACSEAALRYLRCDDTAFEDRPLFEVVRFSYADLVQELIAGDNDAETSLTTMRLGEDLHLAQVRVTHVRRRRRRLALLTLEDATEAFCLRAALETSDAATLVVDAQGRVRAFNKMSAQLFGAVAIGSDASQLLARSIAGLPWWDPGVNRRRKMHIEIDARIYEITSCAIGLPGEEDSVYSVSLLPVARTEISSLPLTQSSVSPLRKSPAGPG